MFFHLKGFPVGCCVHMRTKGVLLLFSLDGKYRFILKKVHLEFTFPPVGKLRSHKNKKSKHCQNSVGPLQYVFDMDFADTIRI